MEKFTRRCILCFSIAIFLYHSISRFKKKGILYTGSPHHFEFSQLSIYMESEFLNDREINAIESIQQEKQVKKRLPLSIHIFAWLRQKSLKRLLDSLRSAAYLGYSIDLVIHLDGGHLSKVKEMIEHYEWPFGNKILDVRFEKTGLKRVG